MRDETKHRLQSSWLNDITPVHRLHEIIYTLNQNLRLMTW